MNWPIRVQLYLPKGSKMQPQKGKEIVACSRFSVGGEVAIGVPSRKNRAFWAKKELGRLSAELYAGKNGDE